jgi:glycosyltransferase involved in cell wall biosynthesis
VTIEQPQRVAIVHEWLTSMRGGEKCVEALCEIFPHATLFALLHIPGSASPRIERMPIRTSFIQHLPWAFEGYRYYLPLFPPAIRHLALEEFDCVISSHHCVAKGVRTRPDALHICYCHTPMRYLWDAYDEYFAKGRAGILTRAAMRSVRGYLRWWDVRTASNPRHYVANSENVRARIKRIYRRDADVIYPPVNTAFFSVERRRENFFLVVSALVPYKRIDLAIEACKRTGDRLVVVGEGTEARRLAALGGTTTEFAGRLSDEEIRDLYARCSAVLFTGEEDFGIVPVEAMASGTPVVALARGGALETVRDTVSLQTGILFREQTVDSLVGAILRLKETPFDPRKLREFALGFDRHVYQAKMRDYVARRWSEFRSGIAANPKQ